jgi:hypothetical protein
MLLTAPSSSQVYLKADFPFLAGITLSIISKFCEWFSFTIETLKEGLCRSECNENDSTPNYTPATQRREEESSRRADSSQGRARAPTTLVRRRSPETSVSTHPRHTPFTGWSGPGPGMTEGGSPSRCQARDVGCIELTGIRKVPLNLKSWAANQTIFVEAWSVTSLSSH